MFLIVLHGTASVLISSDMFLDVLLFRSFFSWRLFSSVFFQSVGFVGFVGFLLDNGDLDINL